MRSPSSVEVEHPKCCIELKANFYAVAGRREKARGYLRGLEARKRTSYVRGDMIARVYSSLGEADNAFKWLGIAYAERSASFPFVLREREFDRFRRDPRYLNLLDRTGFLPSGAPKTAR